MSNTAINIRILWWFYQVTFDGEKTFQVGKYWHERKLMAFLMPVGIYDFKPSMINKKCCGHH